MKRSTFLLALVPSAALLVAADQGLKLLAHAHLRGRPSQSLLGGFAVLQYATNPGGFLSVLGNLPSFLRAVFLVVLPLAFLAGALVWALRRDPLDRTTFAALLLLLGGGLGNLVDRIFRPGGEVIDYVYFRFGPIPTGIMNLADLYILALVILLASLSLREALHKRRAPSAGPEAPSTDPGAPPPPEAD
jgi:signal peptidase II